MKATQFLGTALSAAILVAAADVQATPEASGDYNFVSFKAITSTSPSSPTVINTVTVKCPAAGFLVAVASAQITLIPFNGLPGEADIQYGISKTTAQDINNHHLLRQYTDSGTTWGTAGYQRIDACTLNQTVTYRFVAHKLSAQSADAQKSSLVVTFIRDKI